jgi:hypothetical protein
MSNVEGTQAARELAQRHLDEVIQPAASEYTLALAPGGHEYPTCWMFLYNTVEYLATGVIRYALAGNGPIIVNRRTGTVRSGVSSRPMEDQVDDI